VRRLLMAIECVLLAGCSSSSSGTATSTVGGNSSTNGSASGTAVGTGSGSTSGCGVDPCTLGSCCPGYYCCDFDGEGPHCTPGSVVQVADAGGFPTCWGDLGGATSGTATGATSTASQGASSGSGTGTSSGSTSTGSTSGTTSGTGGCSNSTCTQNIECCPTPWPDPSEADAGMRPGTCAGGSCLQGCGISGDPCLSTGLDCCNGARCNDGTCL
jgi:hypothetical protein